jgi:hypothetical protein
LTDFQKKRLQYFIKAADNYDWVRLGPGDIELLETLLTAYANGHDQGFKEGVEYVVSGEMDWDEMKQDALEDTY